MVAFLSILLTGNLHMNNELFLAYVADDLARQASMQEKGEFRSCARYILDQLSQFQTRVHGQGQEGETSPYALQRLSKNGSTSTPSGQSGEKAKGTEIWRGKGRFVTPTVQGP